VASLIRPRAQHEEIRDRLRGTSESGIRIRQGCVLVGWEEYIRAAPVGNSPTDNPLELPSESSPRNGVRDGHGC
jgi:hypothetical protein